MTSGNLAERAELALKGSESGERFVSWVELADLDELDLRAFLAALAAEGQRRGLVVQWRALDDLPTPGMTVRWRPAQ